MVDFVKIRLPVDSIPALKQHPYLEFTSSFKESTAEIIRTEAEYNGLKFIIIGDSYALLQGSLHKFYNDGFHNANDFSRLDVIEAVNRIKTVFRIDILHLELQNVEIGVNIELDRPTKDILDSLVSYRDQIFTKPTLLHGDLRQVQMQRVIIKAYNKGLQYPTIANGRQILRFELKFVKMHDLTSKGIRTLEDIVSLDGFIMCAEMLIERWSDILFNDPTLDTINLLPSEQLKIHELMILHSSKRMTKQLKHKRKQWYQSLIIKHSACLQCAIKHNMNSKYELLACTV